MDRSDEQAGSYLRESPYTFEGEVEFLQETARYASRRGWGTYVRWSIYLVAVAFAVRFVVAAASAALELLWSDIARSASAVPRGPVGGVV